MRTSTLTVLLSLIPCASTFASSFSSPDEDAASPKLLTLENTTGEEAVSLTPKYPHWKWAEAGDVLISGKGEDQRLIDPRTGAELPEPASAEGDDEEDGGFDKTVARAAFEALEGVDDKLARRISKSTSNASDDELSAVFHHKESLWFFGPGGARQLVEASTEPMEFVDMSPDGRFVAFVMSNDLYVIDTESGVQRRVTESGSSEMFNGKLDWVYQEEIFGRGKFKAFAWSPDSRHVAFLSLDESPVHEFTVIDHIEDGHRRVRPEITNYPKAGDPNPIVSVGIATATDGTVVWLDLDAIAAQEPLVVRFDWTPKGESLLFCVQDRLQTWADLNCADPSTGAWTTWIHEDSESWVNRPSSPRWLEDGTFLWESERTGYNHLYRYSGQGELTGAVTAGEWAVRRVLELDEDQGSLWFNSTRDGAVNTNAYRIGLDGEGLTRLTEGDGTHSITFNGDRSLFLDRHSSLASPGEVRLCDAADGKVLRVLGEADVPALAEYEMAEWESIEITARDGFVLDAAILKPPGFDPQQPHPVWIPTYSGPNAPSVSNRWNSSTWYRFLAQQGVVVLQVNVRTASGRGRWATSLGYKRFGVLELRDLVDAADWATAHSWADPDRVGITGYSYGGFITAYALCNTDKFALGIAGGGVYEWSMYDTIYTERYMSTPEKNPEGYAETSAVLSAPNLNGHLVVHHGVMDDNVHVQNAMHMIYALQKAGKSFDFMLYPQSRHGVRDPQQRWHLRKLEWKAISEELLADSPNPG
ncbi:MAG: dipeptidyl-peptidase-4 [Gammaproteobacteria bacterium]